MTVKRTRGKQAATPLHDVSTESGQIAQEIVDQYGDLAPSVNKIMGAGLAEPGRLYAIGAFRGALASPSDPMRDPRNAIEAGRLVDGTS